VPSKVELKGAIWQNALSTRANTYHSCDNDLSITTTACQYEKHRFTSRLQQCATQPQLEESCAHFKKDMNLQCPNHTQSKTPLQDCQSISWSATEMQATQLIFHCRHKSACNSNNCIRDLNTTCITRNILVKWTWYKTVLQCFKHY